MTADAFKKLCDAVEGYTTLELFEEAQKLLDELPPKIKITREVIILQLAVLIGSEQFIEASCSAESLCLFEPDDVDKLLMVARLRYRSGAFKEALEWLLSVEKKCSGDDHFHYLRAQCHAALGNMDESKSSLKIASDKSNGGR